MIPAPFRLRALLFLSALYLIAPGHPDAPLGGLPLGNSGTFLLVVIAVVALWTRHVPAVPPSIAIWLIAAATVLKLAIAAIVPSSGWIADYYANDRFDPPRERSTHFRGLDATRIDRQLAFDEDQFPVYFFNDRRFNFGFKREVTEPFSVRWRGYLDSAHPIVIAPESRGDLEIAIDGAVTDARPVTIPPGEHAIDVRYRKPAQTSGRLRIMPQEQGGMRRWRAGEVTPVAQSPWRRSAARMGMWAAWLLHAVAALGFVTGVWRAMRQRPPDWVMPAVLLGLTVQGLWKSRGLVDRVWTLTGGDDWTAFEIMARDSLLNGWLMNQAGTDDLPFIFYPGYPYFLAIAHIVTGESLAGAILLNFVALAIATLLVYALARAVMSPIAAYLALAWLLLLQQLDFVRYYTVTLLSENLFFPLVAGTIYLLVRFSNSGRWLPLCGAAVCGGLATITRPSMQLYLAAAAVLVAVAGVRQGLRKAIVAAALFAVLSIATIAPITLRNYLVSGSPVLVTAMQGRSFIYYALPEVTPETKKYWEDFEGGNLSSITILLRILWEYPGETLTGWGRKIGFSFGMTHWAEGISPHPELAVTSILYLAAIIALRQSRTVAALMIHAFIWTHLATLLLSLPWNYGYRMLLPMYLLMPIFVGALMASLAERWSQRRLVAAAR
jgi:hypothetical protein